jgi:hypothetical protein
MPNVNFNLDLNSLFVEAQELDGDPKDLRTAMRDAVVEAAASKLVAGFDHEELHEMRQEVQRVRSELVRERLLAEVDAAMDLPVQRTTRWGEKQGEVVTVRELIRTELQAFLNGTSIRSNRRGYDDKPQNLAELIQTASRMAVAGPLAKQVEEAKQVVNKEIQAILLKAVTERLAGVKK